MMVVRRAAAVLLLTALFAFPRALAADVPIPVQLALFTNVWKLDRNFEGHATATIAILYQEANAASVADKNAVLAWIAAQRSLRAVPVAVDGSVGIEILETVQADVLYVTRMRGADLARVARIARARDIRTMAGAPEYVRLGLSVAIGVRNDRPLIIINLDAARAEGAAYQAQLLRLAEIVRE